MKNFSKLVFTALFMLAVAPAFSQFSIGGDLALPTGTPFSNVSSVGIGASVRYEAPIAAVEKLNWTASAGFIEFIGKSYTYLAGYDPITFQPIYAKKNYNTITTIPLVGGVKYYFQEANKGFYGAADLGLYLYSGGNASETRVGFAPGIGYKMGTWDFTGRIQVMSDFNFLGIRAAYVLGGK